MCECIRPASLLSIFFLVSLLLQIFQKRAVYCIAAEQQYEQMRDTRKHPLPGYAKRTQMPWESSIYSRSTIEPCCLGE